MLQNWVLKESSRSDVLLFTNILAKFWARNKALDKHIIYSCIKHLQIQYIINLTSFCNVTLHFYHVFVSYNASFMAKQ